MFAKISRGDRMAGLLSYLVGPGRSNEHVEPHLVAGDAALLVWHDDNELDRDSARHIASHLDRPSKAYGIDVTGGHVWHCSLSLRAEEGQLPDEKWRAVCDRFVSRMGFDDHEGTKAPARWAAVRHGLSSNGNDHVHLVVNLVREDGTKANIHNDRIRARDLCRELETEFGLEPLESAGKGRASVAYEYAEREAVARRRARGKFEQRRRGGAERRTWGSLPAGDRHQLVDAEMSADQPRWELARKVRACASASVEEGEFVRRLRQHGVLVRPRFVDGRTDVVTGYSVAAKPVAGERPIWYGGGHLAKDLTLPRLRGEWTATPESATAAVAEWTAAKRGRRPVQVGRETTTPGPEVWERISEDLAAVRERLRTIPVEDRDSWALVARQSAGAFAAWSLRTEATPGPLAATADALARSAETVKAPQTHQVSMPSGVGAAFLLMSASKPGAAGQIAVMKQLANLAKAMHDMHQVEGSLRRAQAIEAAVRGDLSKVATALGATAKKEKTDAISAIDPRAAEAAQVAQQGQASVSTTRASVSPLPNKLTEGKPRTRTGVRTGPDRGSGRGSER